MRVVLNLGRRAFGNLLTKVQHADQFRDAHNDSHLMFDEQAAQILAVTDAIAERVRKTGNTTLRSIGDIGRHQSIKDNDAEYVSPADMLNELREDNLRLVESLRAAKSAATEAGDNATEGIVDDWTDQAEERAWFLFEAGRNG